MDKDKRFKLDFYGCDCVDVLKDMCNTKKLAHVKAVSTCNF